MAYLALYRQYRPKNFDEVVGQQFVTQILKNQIISDRIGHAYLLTGIRGTGKTSIAKIFARAVNCPNNTDGNPCNVCEICKGIEQAGVMDIIEIDAASNRGVDEIRDIREKVVYPPKMGRYKVYIIDEVHMLTKEAFNALLKTLEEPPAHVIFILATTEPNKLPATILSRCQRYDIRPITREMIAGQLQHILDDIGVSMEKEAVDFIAHRGDHSMRDALSILDQVIDIRKGDAVITYQEVLDYLGMTDRETIFDLIKAMLQGAGSEAVMRLNDLRKRGIDSLLLMGQLISGLRELAIVGAAGQNAGEVLGLTATEIAALQKIFGLSKPNQIFSMIDGLIEDRQKMRYNDLSSTILEMAVLKQCMPESFVSQPMVVSQVDGNVQPTITSQYVKSSEQPTLASPQTSANDQSDKKEVKEADSIDKATDSNEVISVSAATANGDDNPVEANQEVIQPQPQPEDKGISLESSPIGEDPVEEFAEIESEKPIQEKDLSSDHLELVKKAIQSWSQNKGIMIADMVSRGKLIYQGNGNYVMTYIDPDENLFVAMFSQPLQNEVCQVIKQATGRTVRFCVKSVKQDYNTMNMLEKTAAIVGEAYRDLVMEE